MTKRDQWNKKGTRKAGVNVTKKDRLHYHLTPYNQKSLAKTASEGLRMVLGCVGIFILVCLALATKQWMHKHP